MMSVRTGVLRQVAGALSAVILCTATVTWAQTDTPQIRAGTLTCTGKGGVGLILGSQEALNCVFAPASGGPGLHYAGTITRVGLDIGIKGQSTMIWAVLASTSELPGDRLDGSFGGVAADASLGLGAGAQVLVGGNEKGVVLQPLSVKGQTGLNIAAGVAGLTLRRMR